MGTEELVASPRPPVHRGQIIPSAASVEERETPAPDGPSRRGRGARTTTAFALVGGLLLGLIIAVVGARLMSDDSSPAASDGPDNRVAPDEVDAPQDLLPDDQPIPPGAGAETAEEALTGFLDAEVASDFTTSFGYLDDGSRSAFTSPEFWVASHANELAPITDYEIQESTQEGEDRTLIDTSVSFVPGLDQVIGLTPARASVTWDVVRGDDGSWGVSLDSSAVRPEYPSDEGAVPAVETWAAARQSCEDPGNEWGTVVGSPSLATQLCDAGGTVALGEIEALDEAESQPVFTAFGPETVTAARVVRLSGPAEFSVVVVPIGDEWTVIGILP